MAIQRKYEAGELNSSGFPISMGEALKSEPIASGYTPTTTPTPTPTVTSSPTTSSTSNLPTYRADPVTGKVDYSVDLSQPQYNPNMESTVDTSTLPNYKEIQADITKQIQDFQTQYTQTIADITTSLEDAMAQNKNLFVSSNEALMKQVEESARQSGNSLANTDFVQGAFQAFHGRAATESELQKYASTMTVNDALTAIKLGAPKRSASSNLSDFTSGDIIDEAILNGDINSDVKNILKDLTEDPLNTYTKTEAPKEANQTETEMLRLMDTYRENINQLTESQSKILATMQEKITTTLDQWNIPEMISAAYEKSQIEGSITNAKQFVDQANNLFETTYQQTPDGSVPVSVLSRANAGKFAGLQAAANINLGYASKAGDIMNSYFDRLQTSVDNRITAYQNIMGEAGANVRTGLSLDESVLQNQINTLTTISERIEAKKKTVYDFTQTAAAQFAEPINPDDTEEEINRKIAMANLKATIYQTYAEKYPDTLAYMNPAMTLDELQQAINHSQIYKNTQAALRKEAGLDEGDTAPTSTPETEKWGISFVGNNLSADSSSLKNAITKIKSDTTLTDMQKTAEIAILESQLQVLYPDVNLEALFNEAELIGTQEVENKPFIQAIDESNSKEFIQNIQKWYDLKSTPAFMKGGSFWENVGQVIVGPFELIAETWKNKVLEQPTKVQKVGTLLEQVNSQKITGEQFKGEIKKLLGLTNVGSDTDSALPKEVAIVKEGADEGQCGRFVNKYTGLGLGDSYESKMAKMDTSITEPEAGMVFVMKYEDTGHTGFIVSVDGDRVTVKDSNWSLDEKVKTHTISKDKITGLARV